MDADLVALSDEFLTMVDNPSLVFLVGTKIARLGLEEDRKRCHNANSDDEGPSNKYIKL